MAGENRQERLQEIVGQLEYGRQQLEALNKQIQMIDVTVMDLKSTMLAIEGISQNKVGSELIVPIGSGSYVKAKLADNQKILVGVGGDISLEKSVSEAKEILEGRVKSLTGSLEGLQKSAVELSRRISGLNQEAETLMQGMRG
ncbi:MAG: prefoldin subunit alpha [Candidatus Altiarchaeota archaeon]